MMCKRLMWRLTQDKDSERKRGKKVARCLGARFAVRAEDSSDGCLNWWPSLFARSAALEKPLGEMSCHVR